MDLLKRLFRLLLDSLAIIYGSLFYPTKRGFIPEITNPILLLTAGQISQQIKEGKLKARQVIEAYFKRIEEVNPIINAVIEIRKEAFEDALKIDERIEKEKQGILSEDGTSIHDLPLLGVPFTCKDSVMIEGMHLIVGLKERKDVIAMEDGDIIKNLRSAGAIPIALCNVPELLMWWDCHNTVFGRTKNPYDLSRIPGGSGGGDAASLATGASVIAVASDVGGSNRIPASHCGVWGHKTTARIISIKGKYPPFNPEMESLFSFGPMTRYATDLIPVLKSMAGSNISRLPKIDNPVNISKLQIFYMEGDGDPLKTPLDPEMRRALRRVVEHLETTYSIKCRKVEFDAFKYALPMLKATFLEMKRLPMAFEMTNRKGFLNPFLEMLKFIFGLSSHTLGAICVAIMDRVTPPLDSPLQQCNIQVRDQLKKEFSDCLGENGVFLYPAFPEVATKHGTTLLKVANTTYMSIFNVLGVPVTACPVGLNSEGLPLGVQVAANPYNDHYTIALAVEIEKAFGGWVPPCNVPC